jgi:NADPH:quinone reductase-like Zn-dependent oxidoreductase
MRAVVAVRPGTPDVLELTEVPDPEPREGEVTIAVRAFGLNRAELFTRRGDSPGVTFPRVLGIECVGEVLEAPGTDLRPGQQVVAMMGGMGRTRDGSYAERVRVLRSSVLPIATTLPWEVVGAVPEMLQTANGSLEVGLQLRAGQTVLVRGGTSSVGLTASLLARERGATVLATTRSQSKAGVLRDLGIEHVLLDDGRVAEQVRERVPGGVDAVLELVGIPTLPDSLRAARVGGVVCMTGILGGSWIWPDFQPMVDLPTGVRLTAYSGEAANLSQEVLQRYLDAVAAGRLSLRVHRVFALPEVAEAHRLMEADGAVGKLVVHVHER